MEKGSSRPMLPALIALNPWATNRDPVKVRGGKFDYPLDLPEELMIGSLIISTALGAKQWKYPG